MTMALSPKIHDNALDQDSYSSSSRSMRSSDHAFYVRSSRLDLSKQGRPSWRMEADFQEVTQVRRRAGCKMSLADAAHAVEKRPQACELRWSRPGVRICLKVRMNGTELDSDTMMALRIPHLLTEAQIWRRLNLAPVSGIESMRETKSVSAFMIPISQSEDFVMYKHVIAQSQSVHFNFDMYSKDEIDLDDLKAYPRLRLQYQELISVALSSFMKQSLVRRTCVQSGFLQRRNPQSIVGDSLVVRMAQSLSTLSQHLRDEDNQESTNRALLRCAMYNRDSVCERCSRDQSVSLARTNTTQIVAESLHRRRERMARDVLVKWDGLHFTKRKAPSSDSFAGSCDEGLPNDDILQEICPAGGVNDEAIMLETFEDDHDLASSMMSQAKTDDCAFG